MGVCVLCARWVPEDRPHRPGQDANKQGHGTNGLYYGEVRVRDKQGQGLALRSAVHGRAHAGIRKARAGVAVGYGDGSSAPAQERDRGF